MLSQLPGTQLVTTDLAVGTAGRPIRVFTFHLVASGGGAGKAYLRNGTAATDDIYVQLDTSAASKGTQFDSENGLLFPSGCFYDNSANVSFGIVTYLEEK